MRNKHFLFIPLNPKFNKNTQLRKNAQKPQQNHLNNLFNK